MEGKVIYKQYKLFVDLANQSYSKTFNLDRNIKQVTGLLMSSDKLNLLFYRGSQKIEISGDELFPEDYESKLLISGISVDPNDRYVALGDGVLSGNGEVRVLYKDVNNTAAAFSQYTVSIYLRCTLK